MSLRYGDLSKLLREAAAWPPAGVDWQSYETVGLTDRALSVVRSTLTLPNIPAAVLVKLRLIETVLAGGHGDPYANLRREPLPWRWLVEQAYGQAYADLVKLADEVPPMAGVDTTERDAWAKQLLDAGRQTAQVLEATPAGHRPPPGGYGPIAYPELGGNWEGAGARLRAISLGDRAWAEAFAAEADKINARIAAAWAKVSHGDLAPPPVARTEHCRTEPTGGGNWRFVKGTPDARKVIDVKNWRYWRKDEWEQESRNDPAGWAAACKFPCPPDDVELEEGQPRKRNWTTAEFASMFGKACAAPAAIPFSGSSEPKGGYQCPDVNAQPGKDWKSLFGSCPQLEPCPGAAGQPKRNAWLDENGQVQSLTESEWTSRFGTGCEYVPAETWACDPAIASSCPPPPPHKRGDNEFKKTVKTIRRAKKMLDETVPGWTILLDVLTPIFPVMPLITAAIAASSAGSSQVTMTVLRLVSTPGGSAGNPVQVVDRLSQAQGLPPVASSTITAPMVIQERVAQAALPVLNTTAQASLSPAGVGPRLEDLTKLFATLVQETNTVVNTKGPLEQRLLVAGVDVAQGVTLVVGLALAAVSGGTVAVVVSIISRALTAVASQTDAKTGTVLAVASVAVTVIYVIVTFGTAKILDAATQAAVEALKAAALAIQTALEGVRIYTANVELEKIKKAAGRQAQLFYSEAARLDSEEQALRTEIEKMRKRRELFERYLAWLKAKGRPAPKLKLSELPLDWEPPVDVDQLPEPVKTGTLFKFAVAASVLVVGGFAVASAVRT